MTVRRASPRCRSCGHDAPADLLAVTTVATGAISYLCRPGRGACFARGMRPREFETIALTVDEPALVGHLRHPDLADALAIATRRRQEARP